MKKQEQRELAIEAYTLGCKDVSSGKGGLKTFLESRGLSEELEVGQYIQVISGGSGAYGCDGRIGFITKQDSTNGISGNSDFNIHLIDGCIWSVNRTGFTYQILTNEEVEAALITEAKKRGFKEGVKYNNAYDGLCHGVDSGVVKKLCAPYPEKGLTGGDNQWVMFKGKWATIIEPKPTQMTIVQLEKLTGIEKLEIVK